MKIIPLFTHPQAILGVSDFLLSDGFSRRNEGNKALAGDELASFRMAVNGVEILSPKSASIILSAPYGSGGVNKGLLKPINVYVRKIFIYKTSTNCRKHVH